MDLLCIRHEPLDTLGIAGEVFRGEGLDCEVLDAWEPESRLPRQDIRAVAVFGGAMNVDQTDTYAFLAHERGFLRAAIRDDLPVLGVCLGAQLIARALDVPVVPAPVREFGFTSVRLTDAGTSDPLLSAFDPQDLVFQWHQDMFDLPAGAVLLATGDNVTVQAFRLGRIVWGVQFHPEVTGPEIESWLADEGPDTADRWGKSPRELRTEVRRFLPAHQAKGYELFRRFARLVRTGAAVPTAGRPAE